MYIFKLIVELMSTYVTIIKNCYCAIIYIPSSMALSCGTNTERGLTTAARIPGPNWNMHDPKCFNVKFLLSSANLQFNAISI